MTVQQLCTIEGCDRIQLARGWCQRHYSAWYEKEHPRDRKAYAREWREKNRDRYRAMKRKHSAAYRKRHPHVARAGILRRHGLTIEAFERMATEQGGVCAICSKPDPRDRLHVDHDHATGIVRALLCGPCNRGLGSFRDDIATVTRAVSYLQEHRQ